MGKVKILKTGPMATIQDAGRFGYRKYGIPQSGAMDDEALHFVNQLLGNRKNDPVIEFALMGLKLEVIQNSVIGVLGTKMKINGNTVNDLYAELEMGDSLEFSPPENVYAYFALGGKLKADLKFESYATYLPGHFGGYQGRTLKVGDILESDGKGKVNDLMPPQIEDHNTIHFMDGPEWNLLESTFKAREFKIGSSSNRIGIRLEGENIKSSTKEIKSSAVIPGTIQLTPNQQLIVLMNDCQTTGGYPRIGKVLDKDLRKLAQVRPGGSILLVRE